MASEKKDEAAIVASTKIDGAQSKLQSAALEQESAQVELLDDEGDLSPALTKALEEIFLRFSQSAQDHVKKSGSEDSFEGVEKQLI